MLPLSARSTTRQKRTSTRRARRAVFLPNSAQSLPTPLSFTSRPSRRSPKQSALSCSAPNPALRRVFFWVIKNPARTRGFVFLRDVLPAFFGAETFATTGGDVPAFAGDTAVTFARDAFDRLHPRFLGPDAKEKAFHHLHLEPPKYNVPSIAFLC